MHLHQQAGRRRRQKERIEQQRVFLMMGIGLLLIAAGLVWMQARPSAATPQISNLPAVQGNPAPNIELTTLGGQRMALDNYAGQVVLVNFWATWCPPCKAEMPGINRFYEANKAKGLTVLAVNAREGEGLVRPFIQSNGFSFPVLLDPEGQAVDRYRVNSFPTTFIVDRNGVIRYVQIGMISEAELQAIVEPLL